MVRKLIVILSFAVACSAQSPTYSPGKTKLTVVDVRNYSGTTLCDQITAAATANPNSILDARGLAGGTYPCGAVSLTLPKVKILFNGQTIITTDVGFNLDTREWLDGYYGAGPFSTPAASGFVIQASSSFPIGMGAVTTSGTNNIGSSNLIVVKATGTTITLMPYDLIKVTNDPTIYTVNTITTLIAGGSATMVPITPNLTQNENSGLTVTIGHPVVELGTPSGGSPSSVKLTSAIVSCSAVTTGFSIGVRDNFAQENSQFEDVYVSDCPHGIQIVGHSANSGPFEKLNVNYLNTTGCAGGTAGSTTFGPTVPVEINGAHKKIDRITVTSETCNNAPVNFLIDSPQPTITAPGGIELTHAHGESATTNSDMIQVTQTPSLSTSIGPVTIRDVSGCSSGNPCLNLLHITSTANGNANVIIQQPQPNGGTTNLVKDDVASNTITAANNSNGFGLYSLDSAGTAFGLYNCADATNGFCLYNGIFSMYGAGTAVFRATSSGLVNAYSGTATSAQGLDAIQASVSNTGNTSADASPVNLQCGGAICPSGFYTVRACLIVTTTGTAGTIKIQIGWTDTLGATTQAVVTSPTITSTSRTCSTLPLQSTGSVNITKQVLFTGVTGSPAYAQYITLERQQ